MDVTRLRNIYHQSGFTLVELLTTLTVMITIIATGVPAMQRFMATQHMVTSMNRVASHLHLARSEAIKRGLHAVLCPSLDGESCLESVQWQQGFILFADENVNKKRDTGEELLRQFQSTDKKPQIRITTRSRQWVRYQTTGEAVGSTITMTFCDANDLVEPKAIIISNTGRSRVSMTKSTGAPLDC